MTSASADRVTVSISIDTEEDDWGSYDERGASTRNIAHLRELQELFDRFGARPTYLVNYAPLANADSVVVLRELAARDGVEIGAHCHPWNTPPLSASQGRRSMMNTLPVEENAAKLREVRRLLSEELGVAPVTFRAGRWALGPTVSEPLAELGFAFDCSVCPFMDWSAEGGADYSNAPHRPYRFHAADPLQPEARGALVELPTTVGFLSGDHRVRAALRRRLSRGPARRLQVVGLLDRAGLLALRWLSPETSDGKTMVRLARAWVASGERFLQLTLHSSSLLPGATPFVRNDREREGLLRALETFLSHCVQSGHVFRTLRETGDHYLRTGQA